jgi:hypothetical protein
VFFCSLGDSLKKLLSANLPSSSAYDAAVDEMRRTVKEAHADVLQVLSDEGHSMFYLKMFIGREQHQLNHCFFQARAEEDSKLAAHKVIWASTASAREMEARLRKEVDHVSVRTTDRVASLHASLLRPASVKLAQAVISEETFGCLVLAARPVSAQWRMHSRLGREKALTLRLIRDAGQARALAATVQLHQMLY